MLVRSRMANETRMIPISDQNPTHRFPLVTWLLLLSCSGIFLWQLTLDQAALGRLIFGLGFIPAVIFGQAVLPPDAQLVPAWLTPLTSQFLHGGWLHLISNMLYLWVFADNVEDAMGRVRFLAFYLTCGVIAALVHGVPAPDSQIPMIGASGAISGVLGAYLLLHPRARVTVIVPIGIILYPVRIPAAVVLLAWFGMQLLQTVFTDPGEPGVAFLAHVGGFVAGMLLLFPFRRRASP